MLIEKIVIALLFIFDFALLNRARGSNFAAHIESTTISRLLSMGLMALLTGAYYATDISNAHIDDYSLIFCLVAGSWLLLWFWCLFKWDAYWSAAIGSDPNHSKAWGVGMMTARMSLIFPYYTFLVGILGVPWWHIFYGLSFLLMGVTYYDAAIYMPGKNTIKSAELANGAIIGITTLLIGLT